MKGKRYIVIRENKNEIELHKCFYNYDTAFKEMKKQYELFSKNCAGELNDYDAWYKCDGGYINWRIIEM